MEDFKAHYIVYRYQAGQLMKISNKLETIMDAKEFCEKRKRRMRHLPEIPQAVIVSAYAPYKSLIIEIIN